MEIFAIHLAISIGINLNGKIIETPITLKQRCAKATAIAEILPVANEASIAVTVVPMFAPSV